VRMCWQRQSKLLRCTFKNNHFTEMCCGNEAGSCLRLIDSCITQLQAQGPSGICNESKEEEKDTQVHVLRCRANHPRVELRANLKPISHRCYLFEVAFVWEVTKETIHLPLGCLQGGLQQICQSRPNHGRGLRRFQHEFLQNH